MYEFFHHLFGLCGDQWHPSLATVVASGFGLIPLFSLLTGWLKR